MFTFVLQTSATTLRLRKVREATAQNLKNARSEKFKYVLTERLFVVVYSTEEHIQINIVIPSS